ncbi:helix-turn-helix domain-containing protein [Sunxiuqinia dokdonensis]|uniref:HTH cro/C1-type domain-containing protein n=1 Tax=Sunxiuqinia dokdonensis TaxID=1409788 RepID=A0A0L8V4J2_9BACT|nr:helix-turn-helix transcriptional regulator [Sunxiuqinia dokdonensis]KOH43268.1 hypothetical protein NC99_38980 [Sunxiuqinia dokdonensis]
MDIMDTARLNIKKHRELKGLRQQDLADKLNINIRSYQNLESGSTKLDLERLEQIAEVLEAPVEDLLKQEGVYIHQEIQEIKDTGSGFVYHQEISSNLFDKLLAAKDTEVELLKKENKYLKEKLDQLLGLVGKKG